MLFSFIYKNPKRTRAIVTSFLCMFALVGFVFLYKNYEYNIVRAHGEQELLANIREIKDVQEDYQRLEISFRMNFVKTRIEVLSQIEVASYDLSRSLIDLGPMVQKSPEVMEDFRNLYHAILDEKDVIVDIADYYKNNENDPKKLFSLDERSVNNNIYINQLLNKMTVGQRLQLYDKLRVHKNRDLEILKFYLLIGGGFAFSLIPLFVLVNKLTKENRLQKKVVAENACLVIKNTEAQKQRVRAEENYKNFAYSITHDLRGPIRAIEGFSNLIMSEGADAKREDKQSYISIIKSESVKMSNLIQGITDFTKLDFKEIESVDIDTDKLIKDIIASIPIANPKTKIIALPLPKIKGDYIMISNLFQELIGNAVKFSNEKEVPEVEIGFTDSFYVKDNGVGFSPKHEEKIFNLFHRINPDQTFEGNGVGLSIVRKIVEKHGGKIWAKSRPREGTIINFTLANE